MGNILWSQGNFACIHGRCRWCYTDRLQYSGSGATAVLENRGQLSQPEWYMAQLAGAHLGKTCCTAGVRRRL